MPEMDRAKRVTRPGTKSRDCFANHLITSASWPCLSLLPERFPDSGVVGNGDTQQKNPRRAHTLSSEMSAAKGARESHVSPAKVTLSVAEAGMKDIGTSFLHLMWKQSPWLHSTYDARRKTRRGSVNHIQAFHTLLKASGSITPSTSIACGADSAHIARLLPQSSNMRILVLPRTRPFL